MTAPRFAFFPSPIGRCGIAWSAAGIVGLVLPAARDATAAQIAARFPGAVEAEPPPVIARAIATVTALIEGGASAAGDVPLDMAAVPAFHRAVYAAVRGIPAGTTLSYGALAGRLGRPSSAHAVGRALAGNPFPIVVPCHRVIAADGMLGGHGGAGGIATKLALLSLERSGAAEEPGFAYDPDAAVAHLRAADPALARVIDRAGPFRGRIDPTQSLFHALARAIVYQQLNGRAAATIFARVRTLFPHPHLGFTPEQILGTSAARLRGAGLSANKLLALRDLARRAADGAIPTLAEAREMADEALIERLTQVRGIGRWTVEMLLMFRLGRGDVLPVDDYGIRQGFAVALGRRDLPTRDEMTRYGERWRPYRSVASWYLWRAAEFAAGDLNKSKR
jgi:methylated-DNA-[protein]-cysteine S-methyltransferase